MKYPQNKKKGTTGQTAVRLAFEKMGFGVSPADEYDVGTDMFVHVSDVDDTDLKTTIGCQVKYDKRSFSRSTQFVENECWVVPTDKEHLDYWIGYEDGKPHTNRHVLAIVGENDAVYWNWIADEFILEEAKTHQAVIEDFEETHEKKLSLLIPKNNILGSEVSRDRLICYAKSWYRGSEWSDPDAFSFNLAGYDPNGLTWARYALLLPDLAKPHESKGFDRAITWAEAVALCVCQDPGRWSMPAGDFPSFAHGFEDVPTIEEARSSDDAGWRFAAQYYMLQFEEDSAGFDSLAELPPSLQVAQAAVRAARAYREGRFQNAVSLIDRQIEALGKIDDVDEAWLLVHRGNCLFELALWDDSRASFERCKALVEGKSADKTAVMLKNVAASAIFRMSPLSLGDLAPVIAARDNDLARFSLRRDAVALGKLLDEDIRAWGLDGSAVMANRDTVKANFQISANVGLLSGSIPAHRSAISDQAIIDLRYYGPGKEEIARDLTELADVADEKRLNLAIGRIKRENGPETMERFANALRCDGVTPSTLYAYLAAIRGCGEYLSDESSSDWFDFLEGAMEEPETFSARYSAPNRYGRWRDEIVKCIFAMRFQLTAPQLGWFTDFVYSNSYDLQLVSYQVRGLLELSVALPGNADKLRSRLEGLDKSNWLYPILDGLLYEETGTSREALHREILDGDISNIDRVGGLDGFCADEVEAILEVGFKELNEIVEQSKIGFYMSRGVDFGHLTATFLLRGGKGSHWARVIDFLKASLVENREKASIANVLLQDIGGVPKDAARKMVTCEGDIMASVVGQGRDWPTGRNVKEALVSLLAAMKGASEEPGSAVSRVLAGKGRLGKTDIQLLAKIDSPDLLLLSLCASDDPECRYEAFKVLVAFCCKDGRKYSQHQSLIEDWCMERGEDFPRAFLNAVFENPDQSDQTKAILSSLQSHKSSVVRHFATARLRRIEEN